MLLSMTSHAHFPCSALKVPAALAALGLALGVYRWGPRRRRPVYLLDFDLWRCDPKLKVSVKRFMEGSVACEV
jgi:hypothetical protein